MKYKQFYHTKAGSVLRPIKKGYKLMCCGCGLTHTINFSKIVELRLWIDKRATAAARKKFLVKFPLKQRKRKTA